MVSVQLAAPPVAWADVDRRMGLRTLGSRVIAMCLVEVQKLRGDLMKKSTSESTISRRLADEPPVFI